MISFVVAMDENQVIGRNNELPWHIPGDLAYFKRVTMGHSIVMGRKTHESIGRPLPGRENIILTRNLGYESEACTVIHSLDEIKVLEQHHKEIFVIGGAEIFKELLPIADRLYLTKIHHEFEGDTFFPTVNWEEWSIIEQETGIKDEKNPYDYEFITYERMKLN
ncbi:dihydrofolate reductase [Bacillus salitolerans]|uniref:Dihydrofolate reductase n=1 Tax=Bacillus salitolerans TaxID=1437434 RepID=A0ABW4LV92_9BACI